MSMQIDWLQPPKIVRVSAKEHTSISEAFMAFHKLNPHIYNRLVELTRAARAAGRTHVGIGAMWERLRWDYLVSTNGADFKLNNNYRSRYARLIIANEPELANMFELRALRSK